MKHTFTPGPWRVGNAENVRGDWSCHDDDAKTLTAQPTFEFSGVAKAQLLRSPLERIVMPHCTWRALQVEQIAQGEPLLFLWVKP